jgi:hypothetical protein
MEQTNVNFEDLLDTMNFDSPDLETTKEIEVDLTLPESVEEEKEEEVLEETPSAIKEPEKIELNLTEETNYDSIIKELVDLGEWDSDFVIPDEEGNDILITDLKGIDKDRFQEIKEAVKEFKDKEFKDKYVSVDGLTATQKSLINIVKSGDLEKAEELFKNPQQLQEPFQGYDSSNDNHNINVLAYHYKQQGFSEKKIQSLIKVAQEDLTLDSEAQAVVDQYRDGYKEHLSTIEKEAQEAKIVEEENRKTYRKDLSAQYKEEGFPEPLVKKLVDATTKPDQDGELPVDKVYEQLMKDPKEAKEVALFLLNRQEYINRLKAPIKKEADVNFLKKLNIARKTSPSKNSQKEEESPSNIFETLTFN